LKKSGLIFTLLAVIFLSGCSNNKNEQISNSSHSSTSLAETSDTKTNGTKTSNTKANITKSSTKIEETTKEVELKTTYQSVLDEYTKKLQEEAPKLVDEYNAEYPSIQGGINALAELSNKKVATLAEISNEGVTKMAGIQLNTQDDYSVYEEWVGKLIDVYSKEAQKIFDAYMASSTPEAPEFSEPSYEEYTVESPQQTEKSESPTAYSEVLQSSERLAGEKYTVVQVGEGPDQIAERTGVPVETIFELNGMSPDNFNLIPGQSIRIK
jgi:hypothetical protein